jgi:hypothetical protein
VFFLRQLGRGLRNLLRRSRADEEIADEVESFFAETKADFETRGLTGPEAEAAANDATSYSQVDDLSTCHTCGLSGLALRHGPTASWGCHASICRKMTDAEKGPDDDSPRLSA